MSTATYFISDLHLDPVRPAVTALFVDFLDQAARDCQALYILGDLFEAWVGDDAVAADDPVLAALAGFAARRPLYLMHGNRDFLLGERFLEQTGARLLDDPTVVELEGQPVLLMHGDALCTDDTEYQTLRRQLRSPQWQQAFLARSLEERRAFAEQARAQSSERNSQLQEYLMDVNQQAVEEVMREHRVQHLIHGHTHRPGIHRFQLDGTPAQRVVLGDWYDQGSLLVWRDGAPELLELPLR